MKFKHADDRYRKPQDTQKALVLEKGDFNYSQMTFNNLKILRNHQLALKCPKLITSSDTLVYDGIPAFLMRVRVCA